MAVTGPKTGFRADLISAPGGLFTWGSNLGGQLGNGTTVASTFPTPVTTNYSWLSADMGGLANSDQAVGAAVRSDGTLWTWGLNSKGSLGLNIPDNSNVYYSSPIQVGSLNDWKQVSISRVTNTCMLAVKTDGTLWAWGSDAYGMIGNGVSGSTIKYSSPVQVGALTNWSQVSAKSDHVRAIKTDGTLWTWGTNSFGALGNGTTINYLSPIQVGTGNNWKQVATGTYFGGAVKTDGTLWMWGRNTYGQLGNGTSSGISGYSSPIQVGLLTNWSQVSCGEENTSAVKTDGTLWGWGRNYYGVIGNGTSIDYSSPIQIGSLTNWSKVSTSATTTAAIKTDGTLWGCGYGYVGAGTNSGFTYSPVQLGSLSNWTDVSAHGAYNSIAISVPQKTALYGGLWTIGNNSYGQLGDGTTVNKTIFNRIMTDPIKSVASAKEDSFFIKSDGTLWSMGRNYFGQSGRGNVTSVSSPMQTGTLTNWSQVACHEDFSFMAIKTDGTLWACGYGGSGRLGNGTTVNYSSPIQVGLLTDWKEVRCGNSFALALKNNGTIWTWGPASAALGLGASSSSSYSSPVQIGSLSTWSKIAAAQIKGAAIKTDGTLWMWGVNTYGALGNGTTTNYSSPIQVGLLTNWATVACGYSHTLATKTDGTLWSLGGSNSIGQLGNGTTTDYSSPIQIGSLTNWKQVYTGRSSTSFATKTDGTLWAWGGNGYGQLGMYFGIHYSSPIQVGSLTTWSSVASENQITLAISDPQYYQDLGDRYVSKDYLMDVYPQIASATGARTSPGLYAWGQNNSSGTGTGQLGNGTTINYSSPIQIGALTNWKQVSTQDAPGYQGFSAAIKTDGTLWSWGYNTSGQLGVGATITVKYSSPVQVSAGSTWKQVACGYYRTAAIKTDGTLWGWGYNTFGSTGGGTGSIPVQIGLLTNWKQLSTGWNTCAAIKTDGTLWTWGQNSSGQLGNGTVTNYASPIQVGLLTNWKQVSCAGYNPGNGLLTAVKSDGTLWACGYNSYGQLGNGTTINYSSPIQIGSLTNWKQVSCSAYHTSAIKTDGTLWVWGRGDFGGSLGNGTNSNYSSPIQVGSLTNWKYVYTGYLSTFAIKTDGTLWTWGFNANGELGNGTINVYYSSPIQVGSLTTWKQVVGSYTSLAIADGYY